jgi:hypothetical protein
MIITKKTIKEQIAGLEYYVLEYKKQIDYLCEEAEKNGLIVYRDGDFVEIHNKDYTHPYLVSDYLSRARGTIIGLQLAIDQLKKLL